MTTRLTMPQEVTRFAKPGELLKRPREIRPRKAGRRGEATPASYLDLIRELPCLRCGVEPCGVAAHVRMNSAAHGKRQAMAKRPDHAWTVPLCEGCHTRDLDSQHRVGEQEFWHRVGLNPLLVCERLQRAAPDLVAMRAVVLVAIGERRP